VGPWGHTPRGGWADLKGPSKARIPLLQPRVRRTPISL
jgi:hypothetical protein